MKIVFVLENYYPHIGGVEVVFSQLAEGLAKDKGNDIIVITHKMKGVSSFEVINGVKVHRVTVPSFYSRYFFTFLAFPKVLKLAKDADIIQTTTYNAAPPARWAAMILKKPCVININEILGDRWQDLGTMSRVSAFMHKFLEKRIAKLKFDKFVCISRSAQKDLLKVNPKADSRVIYCGIDTGFWNPKKYDGKKIREKYNLKGKFVYLFYGRPGITKGAEFLIKAVPKISEKLDDSILFMILSKDKAYEKRYNELMKIIEKINIKDKIMIIDPVKRQDLPNYIKMADCIVVPSLSEGFGFTTVESCYMQKHVVASDVDSIPEVIFGSYVLVKPKDPEAIAQAVIQVFHNKTTKSRNKNFTLEKNIESYSQLYKELAENAKGKKNE